MDHDPGLVIESRFEAMTTHIGLWLACPDRERGQAALREVEEIVREAELRLSRFRPESELSRLNANHGQGPQTVSPMLFEVTRAALALASGSGGLVDPTVLPALVRAGYGPGSGRGTINFRGVRLDRRRRTVQLAEGVRLDLGGVAKGWLADRAAGRLSREGPALIDMGGDLRATGRRPWGVGVEHPLRPGHILVRLELREGALATSSVARRRWGENLHHLIDPRTGEPALTDLWQATAGAASATGAEGAAKTALLLGLEAGRDYLAREGLAGILVGKDGRVVRI